MADDEKEGEVISCRGADWEVVSLTASTYAAAADPTSFDPCMVDGSGQDSSTATMFMSAHFVFPPNEHENLPIEPDCSEIHNVSEVKSVILVEEGLVERQDKLDVDSQGTKFFDNGSKFEEEKGFQEPYSIHYPENTEIANPGDSTNDDLNSPHNNAKSSEGDVYDESSHPCAAWWKKHTLSLYRYTKEANTFWSIIVAAALTGLVILGKRWHRDKCRTHELRWHLSINDEKMKGVVGPVGRLKDIVVGRHQRSPPIGGGVAASH